MEKMIAVRSIFRAASSRSSRFSTTTHRYLASIASSNRSLFTLSSPSLSNPSNNSSIGNFLIQYSLLPLQRAWEVQDLSVRTFPLFPEIKDHDVLHAFKDLLAASWDDLPNAVVSDVKKALSKNTDDKAGLEVLKNVFRAAEAVEEFCGRLMTLKMELDDMIGLGGEVSKPTPEDIPNALRLVFQRYCSYLESFGPDEGYLRKKVESELGQKMIFLKMRCKGLGPEWWKVTVLATSGLSGSYIEQRA